MKTVFVCSNRPQVAQKDPKDCDHIRGGLCYCSGQPCNAVEYAPVVRGRWRKMGTYMNEVGIITGFQCTLCGEKWFTPASDPKPPSHCHCGAEMEM